MSELGKWRFRASVFSAKEIYTRRYTRQMRWRSRDIHSPRKILHFTENLGNFSSDRAPRTVTENSGSNGGILFGRRRGLIWRHRTAPSPLPSPPRSRNALFRAHICRRTASNFANFLKLGNFRRGYSILLIHFHEFKHPLAFNRSTT